MSKLIADMFFGTRLLCSYEWNPGWVHCVEAPGSKLVFDGILPFHFPPKISFFSCGLINRESKVGQTSPLLYRLTITLVQNLLLTSKQQFRFGLGRTGQAKAELLVWSQREVLNKCNELPSSAVLRKDQTHFTEPRGLARGLNTTNENQNLLYQAIRPSSGWLALDIAPVRWGKCPV